MNGKTLNTICTIQFIPPFPDLSLFNCSSTQYILVMIVGAICSALYYQETTIALHSGLPVGWRSNPVAHSFWTVYVFCACARHFRRSKAHCSVIIAAGSDLLDEKVVCDLVGSFESELRSREPRQLLNTVPGQGAANANVQQSKQGDRI